MVAPGTQPSTAALTTKTAPEPQPDDSRITVYVTDTVEHYLAWLQDEFGDKRAHGACLANREQSALEFFGRRNEEREQTRALVRERSDDPWRGPQGRADDHDRSSRHGHDDRGGGGSGFSR